MKTNLPSPAAVASAAADINKRFVLTIHDDGSRLRPWSGSITQGVFHVGEPGFTVFRSSGRAKCIRKMLRVVAGIVASEGFDDFTVRIESRP